MTIGRAPGASLVLSDPSVSRVHARISADAVLEDAGSSHGTWLDGVRVTGPLPLRDGAKIRLGDAELRVERRRDAAEAGRTIVVRAGRVAAGAVGAGAAARRGDAVRDAARACARATRSSAWTRPRAASAGCCSDLDSGTFLRLSRQRRVRCSSCSTARTRWSSSCGSSEQRFGATGPARLARLLTDLGERGFLDGRGRRRSRWPRRRRAAGASCSSRARRSSPGVGPKIEALYRARRVGVLHAPGADRRWRR